MSFSAARVVFCCLISALLPGGAPAFAEVDGRLFTDTPSSLQELVHIQEVLKRNVPAAMTCVVCLKSEMSSGSGIVVDSSGTILTAAHVVVDEEGKAQEMEAIFPDGRKSAIKLVSVDRKNDAAIVKITANFEITDYGRMADREPVVGEWVFSLGHGNGLNEERGAMVRLGRVIAIRNGYYKTDCKLIGGDSGGPLFNMKGELIGIHSRVGSDIEANIHVPFPVYKDLQNGKEAK